jgi:glycosyltransferase involved in cell wall biosynthesis
MTDRLEDQDIAAELELDPRPAPEPALAPADPPGFAEPPPETLRVHGKFFFAGERKHFVKGVTYGPFATGSHGAPFPETGIVARDFALMRKAGVNTVRVFTVPPLWLLDAAQRAGLKVLVGVPWSQHVAFLGNAAIRAEIRAAVAAGVRACARHPAVFAYLVGNEIPPDMVRWHGVEAVRGFLRELVAIVKAEHPGALVSYANFPSSEYLAIDFTDFLCFNVYLHDETAFRRYIARLHNFAVDKPLVLTEFGGDSLHAGEAAQAELLGWQVGAAFSAGVAGTFVFAWTDEWFTGGHPIEDWAFGLVDREREAKPSLAAVSRHYRAPLPPAPARLPRVSVVVCAYNAERTMDACLDSLEDLNYPDYEVIVVNDGSTDRTREIAERYAYCRLINQENKGLSAARNVGAAAATGEIVAYTDSDCVADPDWLLYLVGKMERDGLAACGGPNFPPPEDALIPAAVAVSPGGPTHVLVDDEVAEHIAGCNMAFRRDVLLGLGGFDPIFRAAGDDVDFCWRLQDAGYAIGYCAAATVWHFRRNTVRAYIGQQRGYGKAEALVYAKHPARFNAFGQAKWTGRIYGDLAASLLLGRRSLIYAGLFGTGPYQFLYEKPAALPYYLPLTFEWGVAAPVLAAGGIAAGGWGWLLTLPLLVSWALCLAGAWRAPLDRRFSGVKARALVAALIYLGPFWRGYERLKWRIKALQAPPPADLAPEEQPAPLDWRRRGFALAYWNEFGFDKAPLLGGLIDYVRQHRYPLALEPGWDFWDLEVGGDWLSRARLLVCTENHGGDKRLIRVRATMLPSGPAKALVAGLGLAAAAAFAAGLPQAAALLAVAALAGAAATAWRAARFARLIQRIIETVAGRAGLSPVGAQPA